MRVLFPLLIFLLLLSGAAAEPYLAVRTSQPCAACHVNLTGGGLRTQYGSAYAQTSLPAVPASDPSDSITSLFDDRLLFGANARGSARYEDSDDRDDVSRFETDRVTAYLWAQVNDYFSLYVDQEFAPGGSLNREAFVLFNKGNWFLKAGKFFLPFGWRLEDDTALVRQATGINFDNPDNGIEIGYQRGGWNAQLAFTNCSTNDGKQGTFRGEFIGSLGRIGVSASHNNTDLVDRTMYGTFGGLRTGDLSWLIEWNRVEDEQRIGTDTEMDLVLLEANYLVLRGHNLKLTLEGLLPDQSGEDDIYRGSVVWEYFPLAFTQVRVGFRQYDSDDEQARNNREEMFVQLHLFF